jgi:hypothetical protein
MTVKSPFFIVNEFLSPLLCEDLIDALDYNVPDTDKDNHPILTKKSSQQAEQIIYERLQQILPAVQNHYHISYKGTEPVTFEWYPSGTEGVVHAENSEYLRQKWVRVRPADLTAILFLSDYQDTDRFDEYYEVYGGKLEFPQHQFGFNPTRGTLVVFPSDPHFINKTSRVHAGDLFQARIQMVASTPLLYNPADFPGNYTIWF